MMKQRWGLDRNVLRPTPGDPWGVEQHHWNTGAEDKQQLNPGGPSNRQKKTTKKTAYCKFKNSKELNWAQQNIPLADNGNPNQSG